MYNKELFNELLDRSGLKKRHVAKEIGIGYDTFLKKSNGTVEWKIAEAEACVRVLHMTRRERDAVFFSTTC